MKLNNFGATLFGLFVLGQLAIFFSKALKDESQIALAIVLYGVVLPLTVFLLNLSRYVRRIRNADDHLRQRGILFSPTLIRRAKIIFGQNLALRGKALILAWLEDSVLLVDVKNSNQILAEVKYSSFEDVCNFQDRLVVVTVHGRKAKSALWSFTPNDDRPRPLYISETPIAWREKLFG